MWIFEDWFFVAAVFSWIIMLCAIAFIEVLLIGEREKKDIADASNDDFGVGPVTEYLLKSTGKKQHDK